MENAYGSSEHAAAVAIELRQRVGKLGEALMFWETTYIVKCQ